MKSMSSSELQSRERISETKRGWHEIKNEAKYLLHRKMKIIEETKLVKQVVTSTFENQLYLEPMFEWQPSEGINE